MQTGIVNQTLEPITFDKLPEAVSMLILEVRELKMALSEKQEPKIATDKWMNLPELMEYLPDHPAAATIYSWVSSRKIPHHKGAKALRFLKSEIDQWLAAGKRKSESELQTEAEQYRLRKGGVSRHD